MDYLPVLLVDNLTLYKYKYAVQIVAPTGQI